MTALSKVRIYDLAKELKMESKRLIEEVRREGVDVSVPSNTISKELAEKIRNKYFPKKEVHAPRAIRVVKKAARPAEAEHAPEEEAAPVEAPAQEFTAEAPPVAAAEAPPVEAAQEAARPTATSSRATAKACRRLRRPPHSRRTRRT